MAVTVTGVADTPDLDVASSLMTTTYGAVPVGLSTATLNAIQSGYTVTISNVTVDPGSNQRFNVQMKLGQLQEAITVTADAPLLDTTDPTQSTTLDDKYLANLPLITRNYTEMPTVFPGVSYNRGARTSYNQFNVRGGDQAGNNYLLDGGSLNRGVGRAGILIAPSVIERVEFIPGGFSAEYGGYQSSGINLISKSGSNNHDFFFSAIRAGSSFFFSLPSMKGLQGCALTGPLVFQTTLNWPSAFTSPMNTGLCRWWFFSSIFEVMPEGALKVWPPIAAATLSGSKDLAFSTACFHM